MGILSKLELREISDKFSRSKSSYWINEALDARKRSSRVGEVTVFLSHKHNESQELKNTITFLSSLGVSVYVDWLDEGMPKSTSGITAAKIKKKIKEKDKFIFLATEGAISSKWCNWELGYGDAQKYIENIAILPLKESYQNFSGSEYLQIYPYIYESESDKGTYYVMFPDRSVSNLTNWLKR